MDTDRYPDLHRKRYGHRQRRRAADRRQSEYAQRQCDRRTQQAFFRSRSRTLAIVTSTGRSAKPPHPICISRRPARASRCRSAIRQRRPPVRATRCVIGEAQKSRRPALRHQRTVPTFAADLFQKHRNLRCARSANRQCRRSDSDGRRMSAARSSMAISQSCMRSQATSEQSGRISTRSTQQLARRRSSAARQTRRRGLDRPGLRLDIGTISTPSIVADCASGTSASMDIDPATATPVGRRRDRRSSVHRSRSRSTRKARCTGLDVGTDALYAIDKTNGNADADRLDRLQRELRGGHGVRPVDGRPVLSGFDLDLFIDSIYTVDLQTGAANIIGPIGASLGEVDAMGIETVAGPCMQPQDLPWLSLNPIAGMTSPLGTDAGQRIDRRRTGSVPATRCPAQSA